VKTAPTKADDLVRKVPEVQGGFPRNFIRQAVCELRFPTLMSLGGTKPPEKFVAALRKRFPIAETINEFTVGAGQGSVTSHAHQFKSTKLVWTASLKQSAVVLEGTRYTTYADFRERAQEVLDAALLVIDSDFFTRVGLRYINVVPTDEAPMTEWINPALVQPLIGHGFTGISEFAGKLAMSAEDGGCLLQHGINIEADEPGPTQRPPDYVIDIDTYRVDIPAVDVMSILDANHRQAFSLFSWALGSRAKALLQVDSPRR
jgi:uncharacterized protein (TIGR04255 family)